MQEKLWYFCFYHLESCFRVSLKFALFYLFFKLLDAILNFYVNLQRIGLQQIYSEIVVNKIACIRHFRTNLKIHLLLFLFISTLMCCNISFWTSFYERFVISTGLLLISGLFTLFLSDKSLNRRSLLIIFLIVFSKGFLNVLIFYKNSVLSRFSWFVVG